MPTRRPGKGAPTIVDGAFPGDRRDRRPGTHFAAELGAPLREKRRRGEAADEPHVDEDLGVSAYGIDLPFLKH
jgi:hypothetical protein